MSINLDTYEAIYREAAELEAEQAADSPDAPCLELEAFGVCAACDVFALSPVHKDDVLARLKAKKKEA